MPVVLNTTGLTNLIHSFERELSDAAFAEANNYKSVVLKQFDERPHYWRELDVRTIEYKELLKKRGENVGFSDASDVLTNYGVLRNSISLKQGQRFPISQNYRTFRIGLFRGIAPSDRIKIGWQHEFGSTLLIAAKGWSPKSARGIFKQISYTLYRKVKRTLKPLKVGKVDMMGGVNIDRFQNAVKRLSGSIRKKVAARVKVGPFRNIHIPQRSIFRHALTAFGFQFTVNMRDRIRGIVARLT